MNIHPPELKASILFRKGLRELAHHRPAQALAFLRTTVELTPPSCESELSKALYWLSIALLRLDQRDLALKSLANAQKLRRQSHARQLYLRNVNEYGMIRRPTKELDDLYAFVSIQLSSYLIRRPNHRFVSEAEHSTVLKLILEAWRQLKGSPAFQSLECGEKLHLFRTLKIDFPRFHAYDTPSRHGESWPPRSTIYNIKSCFCGSGLPHMQCCGRIQGLSEL
jgi:tetratricopeptide (TPR) repeat protein